MFERRSSFGRIRIALGVLFAVGLVAGIGVATFEESLPSYTGLGAALGLAAAGGVGGCTYYRHLKGSGVADERSDRITYRATALSWTALVVALTVLGTVLTFSDFDVPVTLLVWAFVLGSIVIQEAATEYYRRRM